MHLIRASITASIRPTSLLLHTQPSAPWTKHDFLLLEAYQIIQDEACPSCGLPVWICRNEDNDIQFSVRRATCFATRARELEDERYGPENKKPAGELLIPEPRVESGKALAEFRRPYYEADLKRRQALMSDE